MITYGHLNFLSSFKKLFDLTENGIIYEGKEYKWTDIKKIDRSWGSLLMTLFMYARRCPGATIYLNDDTKIRMNGRVFTKKGEKPKFGAEGFLTSESTAFIGVIDIIEKRIQK